MKKAKGSATTWKEGMFYTDGYKAFTVAVKGKMLVVEGATWRVVPQGDGTSGRVCKAKTNKFVLSKSTKYSVLTYVGGYDDDGEYDAQLDSREAKVAKSVLKEMLKQKKPDSIDIYAKGGHVQSVRVCYGDAYAYTP